MENITEELQAVLNKQKIGLYEQIVRIAAFPVIAFFVGINISMYNNIQDIKEKLGVYDNRINQIEKRQDNVEKKLYGIGFSPVATKKEFITLASLLNNQN